MSSRRQRGTTGVVFDAQGQVVRRLDGCMNGLVSSADGALVAWIARSCEIRRRLTLWVGPGDDLDAPDRSTRLSVLDEPLAPATMGSGVVTFVGEWGATIETSDGIRGYPEATYVALAATGEVRPLRRTAVLLTSVRPQGIGCCVHSSPHFLLDLTTNADIRRSPLIRDWSPDGSQGMVVRDGRLEVVDTRTGTVLRHVSLPAKVYVQAARWEDAATLLVEVRARNVNYSTILRVTESGEIERTTGVNGDVDQYLYQVPDGSTLIS